MFTLYPHYCRIYLFSRIYDLFIRRNLNDRSGVTIGRGLRVGGAVEGGVGFGLGAVIGVRGIRGIGLFSILKVSICESNLKLISNPVVLFSWLAKFSVQKQE